MIYSLTRNPNCCTFTKIISHFVSRHLRNLLAVYFKISLSLTKLINSLFVLHLFSVVRTRHGNRPFSKVTGSTWFGFLLASQQLPFQSLLKTTPLPGKFASAIYWFQEAVTNSQDTVGSKLSEYSVLPKALKWLRSTVWNRHNMVVVGYTESAFRLILWRLT